MLVRCPSPEPETKSREKRLLREGGHGVRRPRSTGVPSNKVDRLVFGVSCQLCGISGKKKVGVMIH